MQPAIVATVDQVLLAKFNVNQWGLVETDASAAAVVFDEIHAYDFYTLGLILNAARELAERDARLCFMSATMPEFIRKAIAHILKPYGGFATVECPEASEEQRHELYVRSEPLTNALADIESAYRDGNKVLVVANTVDCACEIYRRVCKRVGKENALLFHSRFIERDRQKREKDIQEGNKRSGGYVAVTTQIIEVSLDIDYDVMFTQIAPVDALVQRFGRINRRGIKELSPVFLFQPGKGSEKVYGEEAIKTAENLFRQIQDGTAVRQGEIAQWIKKQYPTGKYLRQALDTTREMTDRIRQVRRQLWQIQTLRFSDDDGLWKLAQSRHEQFPAIEVVPECFRPEVENCSHPAQRGFFIVRIPAYLIHKKEFDPELGLLFAEVEYDADYGVLSRKSG
jgi:CRISPR-associated endonuclease/helicase Cas3